MAKARKRKKEVKSLCDCPYCGCHYHSIAKTIGGLIIAVTALVVIFDRAHTGFAVLIDLFLVIMGLLLAKMGKK